MKPYGGKPEKGEYEGWFEPIETRKPAHDDNQKSSSRSSVHSTDSKRADTVRPNVKIEFGVNEIRVTGGGKKSRSFNDGENGKPDAGVGDTGEDCFNFSPTHDADKMKIAVQVHHPHYIRSAKLEMFCRGYDEPIWTRVWGDLWPIPSGDKERKIDEIIPREKNDKTADFQIEWKEIDLPKDLVIPGGSDKPSFTHGVPVVPHSPYRLKFTVSASDTKAEQEEKDKYGYPMAAWTYVHVLVKEIKLDWGRDEWIPRERTDFDFHGYGKHKISLLKQANEDLLKKKGEMIAEFKAKDQGDIQVKRGNIDTSTNKINIDKWLKEIEQLNSKTEEDYEAQFSEIDAREKKKIEDETEALEKRKTEEDNLSREAKLLDALHTRQINLFKELVTHTLSPHQGDPKSQILDVILNVPKFNDTNADPEFFYFQELWGNGPLIPITLKATLKALDGSGVEDPKGLGRAQFAWEWQDNENEDLQAHLNTWRNASTAITKHFLDKVFEDNRRPKKFPCHGFNCPAVYGGKRGRKQPHPGSTKSFVLPATGKHFPSFPARVERPFNKRNWAVVSYADPEKDLKDRDDNSVSSAALFHPTNIAGDRFRISAVLVSEAVSAIDKDSDQDAYYDLIADAKKQAVPWATTYYFEVWRKINASWFHTKCYDGENDGIVDYVEKQMERELGFKLQIEKKSFPNFRRYLRNNIDDLIRDVQNEDYQPDKLEGNFNLNSISLMLRATLKAPKGSSNYAFDALTDIQPLIDLYKKKKWLLVSGVSTAAGREITGKNSGSKAVVARKSFAADQTLYPCLVVKGDGVTGGEDFDCGFGSSLSSIKGTVGNVRAPEAVLWSGSGISVRTVYKTLMSARKVEIKSGDAAPVVLKYEEGKIATRELSDARIGQLKQFCAAITPSDDGSPVVITITGNGDKRGKERLGNVAKWLETNVLDAKQVMFSDFGEIFAKIPAPDSTKEEPRDLPMVEWSKGQLDQAFVNYQTSIVKWRKLFNKMFRNKLLPNYTDWKEEGRALFFYLRGRNQLDKEYTNGAIESDWCNDFFGMAGIFKPALTPAERAEKRWLKSIEVVAAHEFGHLFMLPHSAPRVFDSKEAVGNWAEHLAHDACLMNYDPDTESLCGFCMLRKRGWKVSKVVSDGKYLPTEAAWIDECKRQMEADAPKGPAQMVRLAMFLLDMNYYMGVKAPSRVEEARRHMKAARALVPADCSDEKHIFLLRCEEVFHLKVAELDTAKTVLDALTHCSNLSLDIADWKYNDAEKRYVTDGSTGQHWKMQQSDKELGVWFMSSLAG